jgi:signal transduction histidine kinase
MDPQRKPDLRAECLVHDLNNAFQTVIEAADLIASDPAWAPIAAIILRSVDQGRRMVSGFFRDEIPDASLGGTLERAMQFALDFVAASQGPALEFVADVEPDLQIPIRPSELERVMLNLFINAVQAAAAAGRTSTVMEVRASHQHGRVRIVVADDGPGLSPEILPLIFAPRFSTDQARLGLGLHIVSDTIARSGGSVTVANRPGGGAAFTLEFPSVLAHSVAATDASRQDQLNVTRH